MSEYLRAYGPREDSHYAGLDPDFGRRLQAMLERAPDHVRRPGLFESLYRDDDAQRRAINSVAQRLYGRPATIMEYSRGIPGHAAPVGGSQHQSGRAADIGWSSLQPEGRDWLRSNAGAYGLRFPLPDTDAGHLEYDANWQGQLPNQQPASVSRLPSEPPPIMNSALTGLGASRSQPAISMPPIFQSAVKGFDAGGSVGEFANTKQDADNIDFAVQMERGIQDNPNSYRGMAAVLGAVDAIPGPGSDMYSRARANYPYTYRAAQAAALAPVVALAPKVGLPWAALSVARDPLVTQYYHDNIAPRGFRDGGAVEAALRIAARHTDTNPSDAAKEAGNYRKGKVTIHSMEVAIENPKGSQRSGIDKNGKRWVCELPAHYGYLLGTVGADKDHVDCYIGPDHSSEKVFVVDQIDAQTGRFDEHKCMFDYPNKTAAVADYRKAFSDGKADDRIGAVTEMSVADFKEWVKSPASRKPVGKFANGGTVMPHKNAIATALDVARRAMGGRVGYADGGEPLVPGGLPPLPEPLSTFDWTPETQRGVVPRPPAARSANTAMGDLLARYSGSDDLGENVSGLERGAGNVLDAAYQFSGVPLAAEAGRHMSDAVETGDILRGMGAAGEMGIAALPASRVLRNLVTSSGVLGRVGVGATVGGAPLLAAGALTPDAAAAPPDDGLTPEMRTRRDALQKKQVGDKRNPPTQLLRAEREELNQINQITADFLKQRSEARFAEERRLAQTAGNERDRQVREAVEARDQIRGSAPKPFNEEFPTLSAFMPFAPIALGAATGALWGLPRLRGERAALGDWRAALDRAGRTTSPNVREQMSTEASAINRAWPEANKRDKFSSYLAPMAVAGAEGAAVPNLPYAYNAIRLPEQNPERTAQQEYYRRLPEDHPDRARTLEMLNNEAVLPRDNPPFVEAREYFSNLGEKALPRALAGAGEAMAFSLPGTTVTNAMRPYERALPRATTEALEKDVASRPRPSALRSSQTPPALTELPTPLPALPAPPPAAPPPALQSAPAQTGPQSRTSSPSTSDRPPHHSQLQPREAGRFAGPPKKPRRRRDPEAEAIEHHSNPERLTNGQQNGGAVQAALNIARRLFGGRVNRDSGGRIPERTYGAMGEEFQVMPLVPEPLSDIERIRAGSAENNQRFTAPGVADPFRRYANVRSENEPFEDWRRIRQPGLIDYVLPHLHPDRNRPEGVSVLPGMPYAQGGEVTQASVAGPIRGPDPGRADMKPVSVKSGSFVVSADIVSGLGQGNTEAGMARLEQLFGGSKAAQNYAAGGSTHDDVPIKISSGEYVIPPEGVAKVGSGDMSKGHAILDKLMLKLRKEHVEHLKSLPPPARG